MEFGGEVGVCAKEWFAVVELGWLGVSVPQVANNDDVGYSNG